MNISSSESKRQFYNFSCRFYQAEFTLQFTYHATVPRIKRFEDEIIRESRIIKGLTTDKVNELLSDNWLKMFKNDGKYKVFIPANNNKTAIMIILTKKIQDEDGTRYKASIHSSYLVKNTDGNKIDQSRGDEFTVFLTDKFFDTDFVRTPSTDEEKEAFIISESARHKGVDKKRAKEEKKWQKKQSRNKDKYNPASNQSKSKRRAKVYIPTNQVSKAQRREIDHKKSVKERRNRENYMSNHGMF